MLHGGCPTGSSLFREGSESVWKGGRDPTPQPFGYVFFLGFSRFPSTPPPHPLPPLHATPPPNRLMFPPPPPRRTEVWVSWPRDLPETPAQGSHPLAPLWFCGDGEELRQRAHLTKTTRGHEMGLGQNETRGPHELVLGSIYHRPAILGFPIFGQTQPKRDPSVESFGTHCRWLHRWAPASMECEGRRRLHSWLSVAPALHLANSLFVELSPSYLRTGVTRAEQTIADVSAKHH